MTRALVPYLLSCRGASPFRAESPAAAMVSASERASKNEASIDGCGICDRAASGGCKRAGHRRYGRADMRAVSRNVAVDVARLLGLGKRVVQLSDPQARC